MDRGAKIRTATFDITAKFFLNVFFAIISILSLYPLVWMAYSGFKTDGEFALSIIKLPASFDLKSYERAIRIGKLDRAFLNNLYIAPVCVILITVFSFIVAYFLNRFRFKGRNLLFILFTLGLLTPIHGFLVPLYIQFSKLRLIDNWYSLFFPLTAFNMPLAIILYENFLNSVPHEVEESAMIDGATTGQQMAGIAFPMCKPIISTVMVVDFLWVWNEFPFALVLINKQVFKTLSLGLSNFRGEHTISYPPLFAALTLVTIPIIIVYAIFSKQIMEGMTAGAVKG
jgi:raffinose/stachyose/melibiose transport system permease protein